MIPDTVAHAAAIQVQGGKASLRRSLQFFMSDTDSFSSFQGTATAFTDALNQAGTTEVDASSGTTPSGSTENTADLESGETINGATGNSSGSVAATAASNTLATGSISGGDSFAASSGGLTTGFANGLSSRAFPAFGQESASVGAAAAAGLPSSATGANQSASPDIDLFGRSSVFGSQGATGFGETSASATMGGFGSNGGSTATSSIDVDADSDQTSFSDQGLTQTGDSELTIDGGSEAIADSVESDGGGVSEATTLAGGSTEGFSGALTIFNETAVPP